jgi:hypothetical protein
LRVATCAVRSSFTFTQQKSPRAEAEIAVKGRGGTTAGRPTVREVRESTAGDDALGLNLLREVVKQKEMIREIRGSQRENDLHESQRCASRSGGTDDSPAPGARG